MCARGKKLPRAKKKRKLYVHAGPRAAGSKVSQLVTSLNLVILDGALSESLCLECTKFSMHIYVVVFSF